MFSYDKKWEHQLCTNFIWKQNCCQGKCTISVILYLVWCILQVPSLKSTALIFLKIFYILWFVFLWNPQWLYQFFLTNTWISPEWEAIFQKQEHHSSFVLKAFQISFIYFLLHRHFKLCGSEVFCNKYRKLFSVSKNMVRRIKVVAREHS